MCSGCSVSTGTRLSSQPNANIRAATSAQDREPTATAADANGGFRGQALKRRPRGVWGGSTNKQFFHFGDSRDGKIALVNTKVYTSALLATNVLCLHHAHKQDLEFDCRWPILLRTLFERPQSKSARHPINLTYFDMSLHRK